MRRGFSLIEMMAVIAVSAVLFTVLAVGVHALSRTQMLVQSEAHTAAALHDFARRLREDAHAARDVALTEGEAGGPPATLTFRFADGRSAAYDFHPDAARLRRRVMDKEQTVRRDTFPLSRGATVQWRLPEEGEPPLLSAVIARPVGKAPKEQAARRTLRIEAAVGLDRRTAP